VRALARLQIKDGPFEEDIVNNEGKKVPYQVPTTPNLARLCQAIGQGVGNAPGWPNPTQGKPTQFQVRPRRPFQSPASSLTARCCVVLCRWGIGRDAGADRQRRAEVGCGHSHRRGRGPGRQRQPERRRQGQRSVSGTGLSGSATKWDCAKWDWATERAPHRAARCARECAP
jgi:hypothetical protein